MRLAESEHAINRLLETQACVKDALKSLGYTEIACSESEILEIRKLNRILHDVYHRLEILRLEE